MKTKKKLTMLALAMLVFAACEEVVSPETISPAEAEELKNDAVQYSQANNSFGGTLNAISTYGISEDLTKHFPKNGPERTYDSINFIVTLTYPNNGGIITIDWDTIPVWTIPSIRGVATITNFVYGGATVNGTLTLTTVGNVQKPALNANGELSVSAGGLNSTYQAQKTFTWEEGFGNPDTPNVFSAYGTGSLTIANKIITSTIPQQRKLLKQENCVFPNTGIINLAIQRTTKEISIDYGVDQNGNTSNDCDSYAKLTLKVGNATLTMVVNLAQ